MFKHFLNYHLGIAVVFLALLSSCSSGPKPIEFGVDDCDFCKMTISDGKFGAELITAKGRVYKFDDIHCMISYQKENINKNIKSFYVHDFNQNNMLIPAETAFYATGGAIKSPMRGNTIAVQTDDEAMTLVTKFKANPISWAEIIK